MDGDSRGGTGGTVAGNGGGANPPPGACGNLGNGGPRAGTDNPFDPNFARDFTPVAFALHDSNSKSIGSTKSKDVSTINPEHESSPAFQKYYGGLSKSLAAAEYISQNSHTPAAKPVDFKDFLGLNLDYDFFRAIKKAHGPQWYDNAKLFPDLETARLSRPVVCTPEGCQVYE
jgi:hypothetical protein